MSRLDWKCLSQVIHQRKSGSRLFSSFRMYTESSADTFHDCDGDHEHSIRRVLVTMATAPALEEWHIGQGAKSGVHSSHCTVMQRLSYSPLFHTMNHTQRSRKKNYFELVWKLDCYNPTWVYTKNNEELINKISGLCAVCVTELKLSGEKNL